jgi:hypothetical protein
MKLFIGILIFMPHLAFAADRCPDFSGKYMNQGEDGQVFYTITQQGCQQMTIERTNNYLGTITKERHKVKLDGVFHPDSSWYGGRDKEKSSAKFVSGKLELVVASASSGKIFWKEAWEFLPDGNIAMRNDAGHALENSPMVAQRQK